jgi:hypothetical protein
LNLATDSACGEKVRQYFRVATQNKPSRVAPL